PVLCAALYLTLHSFMLKAFAEGIIASGRKIAVIGIANRREMRRSNMKSTLKIDDENRLQLAEFICIPTAPPSIPSSSNLPLELIERSFY
ncbi:hypothetical protein, partial [Phyllobacterium sp. P5_D12]